MNRCLEDVITLRSRGLTPKEIARKLGLRPADVNTLVRSAATSLRPAEDPLVGCFANCGWSRGLTLDNAAAEWREENPPDDGSEGLVTITVGRRNCNGKINAATFLVDVFCLGVKKVRGPYSKDELAWREFREWSFRSYEAGLTEISIELTQELVFGAVDYARGLGFTPVSQFEQAKQLLGQQKNRRQSIRFGRWGRPYFIAGPRDDVAQIRNTLDATVGPKRYDFLFSVSV